VTHASLVLWKERVERSVSRRVGELEGGFGRLQRGHMTMAAGRLAGWTCSYRRFNSLIAMVEDGEGLRKVDGHWEDITCLHI
jgi:hypothetical protein